MGIILPFIWTKSLAILLLGAPAYVVMWFTADKEPKFFEVLRVSYGKVRGTRNAQIWGGDSFGS